MENEELYDAALKAITELFSDCSVSPETARNNLQSLSGEIDVMLDSIKEESDGL